MTRSSLTVTFQALQRCGYEATAVELAEILWLANYLPGSETAEPPAKTTEGVRQEHPGKGPIKAPSSAAAPAVQPASPPIEQSQATGLFSRVADGTITGPTRPATLVRAPAPPALPRALSLSRALRPLLRRRASTRHLQLDEDATADATAASGGHITPVFRPGAERWFEVALVIDDSDSMQIWKQMTAELHQLLVRHGGFRDLRRYRLKAEDGRVALISTSNRRVDPKTISDPSGHRLVIVVTDAVSESWQQPSLRRALFEWSRFSPIVMLQVLPRRMWPHTAVGLAEHVMRPRRAGAPTAEWLVDHGKKGRGRGAAVLQVPVMPLESAQFGQWARSLMQVSAGLCTGAVLGLDPPRAVSTMSSSEDLTARERLQRFRAVSSPEAYQLACYFATRPLTLPVMRIVQRQMMPATGTGELAEFLLGGLIYQVRGDAGSAEAKAPDPETTQYEFYPGVRDILLDQIQEHEAARIVRSIEEYLSSHLGESVRLETLIPDESGKYSISASAMPFVVPGIELLERMGVRPRAAAARSETERILDVLHRHFGADRLPRETEQQLHALRVSPEEQRYRAFSIAVELMSPKQRELMLPLGVTESAPAISPGLWQQLLDRNNVRSLEELGGLSFDDRAQLTLHQNLRNALREQVATSQMGSLHGGIVGAYQRSRKLPGREDRYYYTHFMKHVAAAGDVKLAEDLLFDVSWIAAKIQVQRVPQYLDDLKRFPDSSQIQSLYEVASGKYQHWEDAEEWAMSLLAAWENRYQDAAEADEKADVAPRAVTVGNVYKGRVKRVLGGMQSAFVDIGFERDAFLYVSEVVSPAKGFEGDPLDEGGSEATGTEQPTKPRIEELLREGQEILVQVIKEPAETDGRGARVTMQISLPGRFLVFMPTMDFEAARSIESPEERRRLIDFVREFRESQGFIGGVIVNAAASGRSKDEIFADLAAFQVIWGEINGKLAASPAPSLLFRALRAVEGPAATITPEPRSSVRGWVLVAGLSSAGIQSREVAIADTLGRLLSDGEYGLISGDSPGVDMAVAAGFGKVLRRRNVNVPDVLLYLTRAQRPTHSEGTVVQYSTDREFVEASLSRADAVIVVGSTPFLKELEAAAIDRLIPLITVTAPARSEGFTVTTNVTLTGRTVQEQALDQSALIELASQTLPTAIPGARLQQLAEQYLRSSASNVLKSIESRMITLWPRVSLALDPASERPDVRLLRAIGFRHSLDAAMLEELTQDDESMHVVLQRMLSLKAAFGDARTRQSLPRDLESRLARIFRTVDDGSRLGALASQVRTFLAQELLPLARVVTMVDRAGMPDFRETDAFINVAEPLSDQVARELLEVYDPGWRMAGLARAAARPLEIDTSVLTIEAAEGSEHSERRTVRAILGAIRFESTFPAHVRLALLAVLALAKTGLSLESLSLEDRNHLDLLVRPITDDDKVRELRRRLEAAGTPSITDVREKLTDRENEVFRLLASGKSARAISIELALPERTVKAHRTRLLEKIGVRSDSELAAYAAALEQQKRPGRDEVS